MGFSLPDTEGCRSVHARAHLSGSDDKQVKVQQMLERVGNWHVYLESGLDESTKQCFNACLIATAALEIAPL